MSLKRNSKGEVIEINPLRSRKGSVNFEMTVHEPYKIEKTGNVEEDTKNIILKVNQVMEKMIIKNPTQWIWSHNRWK